jgi:hypothetical protein
MQLGNEDARYNEENATRLKRPVFAAMEHKKFDRPSNRTLPNQ